MIISAEKKEKCPAAITIIKEIVGNTGLIKELAKNDFKKNIYPLNR